MAAERVLVSMKRFLGDAIMASPLLDLLEAEFRNLTIITTPTVAQILPGGPGRRFQPLETKRRVWDVMSSAFRLRRSGFTVALVVNHSFRSAVTVRLAGIRRRIGHDTEGRKALLTDAIPYSQTTFEADCMLDLARPLGFDPPHGMPRLLVSDAERRAGAQLIAGPTIGIQPGASVISRRLPLEVCAEVAEALRRAGLRIAIMGGKDEIDIGLELERLIGAPADNLVGKSDVRTTLGVLANLSAMVGPDSGLMHLAATSGCPSVTVFGPAPASKWGHPYPTNQVISAKDGDIRQANVQDILTAVNTLLARPGQATSP